MIDLDGPIGRDRFAALVGCSKAAAKRLVDSGVLVAGATAREWIVGYLAHLRIQAAGHTSEESLTVLRTRLTTEKAKLAQRDLDVQQGRLVPVALMGNAMFQTLRQAVNHLDCLVPDLRIRFPAIPVRDLQTIDATITTVRNRSARDSRQTLALHRELDAWNEGE